MSVPLTPAVRVHEVALDRVQQGTNGRTSMLDTYECETLPGMGPLSALLSNLRRLHLRHGRAMAEAGSERVDNAGFGPILLKNSGGIDSLLPRWWGSLRSKMGERRVDHGALFYEFSLERHVLAKLIPVPMLAPAT